MCFIRRVGASDLHLAPSTALLMARRVDLLKATNLLRDKVRLWLLSTAKTDIADTTWNVNAPIARGEKEQVLDKILAIDPSVPVMFDAVYKNPDEEYADVRAFAHLAQRMLGGVCARAGAPTPGHRER